jgi:hypothetical protein
MQYFLIALFILITACNSNKAISHKKQVIELGCDSFINKYSKLNPCEKLKLVKETYPLNNSCYEYIGNDMYKLTGISYSMSAGHIGTYYSSDSLLKKDLEKWGKALKCLE